MDKKGSERMNQQDFQKDYIEEEEYQEDRKYIWLFFIIALCLLLFIVIGFTYSLYSGTIEGSVQPIPPEDTNIIFNYSDTNGSHNGISLSNVQEMSDVAGKKQIGNGRVFDFSVSGETKEDKIKYLIVLKAEEISTISDSDVKVYLTSRSGGTEVELNNTVPTYEELEEITIDGEKYKILYEQVVDANSKFDNYYRFRMWIREGASDYYGKTYSLKVNVLAEGVGE